MHHEPIITREIATFPARADDAHKGDVGRVAIVGGCCDADTMMAGAPALTAMAAFRSGAGLVQLIVPEPVRPVVTTLAPTATTRSLRDDSTDILTSVKDFRAVVLAIGPGLGKSITPDTLMTVLREFEGPIVLDADGLNILSNANAPALANPSRIILTPHTGEADRLLQAVGLETDVQRIASDRNKAALALVEALGCCVVLKGQGTIVTNGDRLYVNETGNAGMATGGAGDVLTGVIAALIGQGMTPIEAAILGVYLHGLAGDFAAEELGRRPMTALDIIEYLPEAINEHELASSD